MKQGKIVFDDGQIKKMASALRRPSGPTWSVDRILQVIQVLAVVIGGCWVLFQFLVFERESLALANQAKSLSNDLARLTLELQRAHASLRTEELKHSVELGRLQALRASQSVRYSDRQSFKTVTTLGAKKVQDLVEDMVLYEVEYSLKIENLSEKPLEVSAWVLDCDLAHLPQIGAQPASMLPVSRLGHPADRWHPLSGADPEGLSWKRVGTYSAIFSEAQGKISEPWDDVVRKTNPIGGAFVGPIGPGASLSYCETFLVRASEGTYMGLTANVCFDRVIDEGTGLYATFSHVRLGEGTENEPDVANTH